MRLTTEGTIPEPSQVRLRALGTWLAVNGTAIYGTRPGPWQDLAWGRSTTTRS
jgi:alpha-L-fucosidase